MQEINFNVVIPSIKIDNHLINCVKFCLLQTYSNFLINLVIEQDDEISKIYNLHNPNKIEIKITKTQNINISTKRNIGAKKTNADYLAFIDSDAYPDQNWLKNIYHHIKKNKEIVVVGGPSGIGFPNEKFLCQLTNLAKKSFFCTGNLSFRKYSNDVKFCTWLESCNFIINKKKFDELSGMNDNIYIFEDLELCYRINQSFGKNKILYAGDVVVFHKDRSIINFLKQRFVFGLHIDHAIKYSTGINKLIPLVPLLSFILICMSFLFIKLFITLVFLSFLMISYNLVKFKINSYKIFLTTIIIYLANFCFILANVSNFLGLKNYLSKRIYRNSK